MELTRSFFCVLALAFLLGLGLTGCAATPAGRRITPPQADSAYARGDLRDALAGYLAWPGGNSDPHIQAKLGNCAALLGQPELAEHAYRRALQLQPDQPDVRYNLAVLLLKQAQSELIAALPQAAQSPQLRQHIQDLLHHLTTASLAGASPPSATASDTSPPIAFPEKEPSP